MSFKQFFLNEAKTFNMGEAFEGIFAIGVALHIAEGKVDTNKLHDIRRQVVIDGKKPFTTIIDSAVQDNNWVKEQIPEIQGDKIQVGISINLRPNNVKGAFGPGTEPTILNRIIELLASKIENTKAVQKINEYIIRILKNRKTDDVIFYVVADGVGAGTKGENVKGDVTLKVSARTNTPVPEELERPISFSLKVDNPKVAQKSVFDTLYQLGKVFNLPMARGLEIDNIPSKRNKLDELFYLHKDLAMDDSNILFYIKQYQLNQDKAYSHSDSDDDRNQQALQDAEVAIQKALQQMHEQMEKEEEKKTLTQKSFSFLEKDIFGSDIADVININQSDIKELTKADFDTLKELYEVEYSSVGNEMVFIAVNKETNKRQVLFKLTPNLRITPSQKQQNIQVSIGNLFYND